MANRPSMRVAVLIDLERRPAAGGHVKFWEHIASAAAGLPDLELTLHFLGKARHVERLAPNVAVQVHRPVLNSAWIPGLERMPDHSDLAPWHPGLAAQLKGVDVVHCTDALFAFARTARRWCGWHGTPMATSLHTDSVAYCELYAHETFSRWLRVPRTGWRAGLAAGLSRHLGTAMERRLRRHLKAADHVFASGMRLQALAQTQTGASVSALRRGLEHAVFNPEPRPGRGRSAVRAALGIPESAMVLCFSGRLSPGKQVMRVAHTAAALVGQGYDVHAVFAGQGPQARDIQAMLGERGHLVGQLPQPELADVLRASDVFVFPSRVEIWANVVAEARACGVPVLVDADGGGQLLLTPGEDGLVVADNDAAWVEAARMLLDEPARRQAMRQAGLRVQVEMVPTWQQVLTEDLLAGWRRCVSRAGLAVDSTVDFGA